MSGAKKLTTQKVIHAGLQAFNTHGIQQTTLNDIADKLGVDEKQLYPFVQKPNDIFNLITRYANEKLAQSYETDDSIPKRDQYFDLIMERLDILQPYKTDIESFVHQLPKNPLILINFFPDFERSIILMMRLACDVKNDQAHIHKRLGLTWAYLSTLRVWVKDDSPDNAKTMAHLDKCLARLEHLADKNPLKRRQSDTID